MSNFLAIATVTETLRQMLETSVSTAVNGATATAVRPAAAGAASPVGLPNPGVNIFLYQVSPNAAWRNMDLPNRRDDGSLVTRPRVALDLHYLLTFYGGDSQLEPQRLLGRVAQTLHAQPMLTRQQIRKTITAVAFLSTSNLADDIEQVKFSPLSLSLEDLSKLWSVFFQTPYSLSVAYQGTVVLIEGDESPQQALPVRGRNLYVLPFRQPVIEEIRSKNGPNLPIVAGDRVVIRGRQLQGDVTKLRVGAVEVTPVQQDVSNTEISLPLKSPPFPTDTLRAGVQGVQVVHPLFLGIPLVPHRGVESNVVAFVIRPTIKPGGPPSSTSVSVQVNPEVKKGQRVVLLLNEQATTAPAAYTFAVGPVTSDMAVVTISISGVKPGNYFVRLQVDGAESVVDLDPASPTFGPTVTVP